MKQVISTKTLIREMDATELLDYLTDIWINDYNKNTEKLLLAKKQIIVNCVEAYKQLTNKNILFEISEDFSYDYICYMNKELH
jgi:hypothetical protein